jgi:hypothetical protein
MFYIILLIFFFVLVVSFEKTQMKAENEDKNDGRKLSVEPNKIRITSKYATKYEVARILGTRSLQIR